MHEADEPRAGNAMQRSADVVGGDLAFAGLTLASCKRGRLAEHEQHQVIGIHPRVIADRLDVGEDQLRVLALRVESPQPLGRDPISLCTTLNPPASPTPAGRNVGEFSFSGVCVSCDTRPLARSKTIHVDLLAVVIRGKQDARAVRTEVRLVVVAGRRSTPASASRAFIDARPPVSGTR